MKKRFFAAAATLSLLVTSLAQGGIYVTGGLTHQSVGLPGQRHKGTVVIRNSSDLPREAKIYQTDYSFTYEGVSKYGAPGELVRSNADWVSFSPRRMIVPADDTVTVNYTVRIPADPNLVGTYWSMFMVEEIPDTSPESTIITEGEVKIGITQVMRYAIQVITHIGDTGERRLNFMETKLLKEESSRTLEVDIENVGERWLRPFLWAELYDGEGRYVGKFEAGRRRIYPDTSVRYKVDLSEVPVGSYKALVVADCGGDFIFGANYNLKFE